jgi:HK97 family phage prohead protease
MTAPVDNLVRSIVEPDAASLRAATGESGDGRTLFGHFAVFNRWTEINSMWEGNFLERLAPGAFNRSFRDRRDQVKVLYDHGKDPQLGNKPLGSIVTLREDATGAFYEVDLLETSYNDDFVIPAARAGLLGASFRFRVVGEDWHEPRDATKANPGKLAERTITDVDLYEFGPVTFPAYPDADVSVAQRSYDQFLKQQSRAIAKATATASRVGEIKEFLRTHGR